MSILSGGHIYISNKSICVCKPMDELDKVLSCLAFPVLDHHVRNKKIDGFTGSTDTDAALDDDDNGVQPVVQSVAREARMDMDTEAEFDSGTPRGPEALEDEAAESVAGSEPEAGEAGGTSMGNIEGLFEDQNECMLTLTIMCTGFKFNAYPSLEDLWCEFDSTNIPLSARLAQVFLGFSAHVCAAFDGVDMYVHYILNTESPVDGDFLMNFSTDVHGVRMTLNLSPIRNRCSSVEEYVDKVRTMFMDYLDQAKKGAKVIKTLNYGSKVCEFIEYQTICILLYRAIGEDIGESEYNFKQTHTYIPSGCKGPTVKPCGLFDVFKVFSRKYNEKLEKKYYSDMDIPLTPLYDGDDFWKYGKFTEPYMNFKVYESAWRTPICGLLEKCRLPLVRSIGITRNLGELAKALASIRGPNLEKLDAFSGYRSLKGYMDDMIEMGEEDSVDFDRVVMIADKFTKSTSPLTLSTSFWAAGRYMASNFGDIGRVEFPFRDDNGRPVVLSTQLSPLENFFAKMLIYFEKKGSVSSHFDQIMVLTSLMNAYNRKEELHLNLLFSGEAGVGKSYNFDTVLNLIIDGTADSLAHITEHALNTGDSKYDGKMVFNELPAVFDGGEKKGETGSNIIKTLMSECKMKTKAFESDPNNPGRRAVDYMAIIISVYVAATNKALSDISGPVKDRFLCMTYTTKSRLDYTICDAIREGKARESDYTKYYPHMANVANYVKPAVQCLEYYLMRVELLIALRIIPDVEMEYAKAYFNKFMKYLETSGFKSHMNGGQATRDNVKVNMIIRQFTLFNAVLGYLYTHDVDDNIKSLLGVAPYLYADEHILVLVLSLLWDRLIIDIHMFYMLESALKGATITSSPKAAVSHWVVSGKSFSRQSLITHLMTNTPRGFKYMEDQIKHSVNRMSESYNNTGPIIDRIHGGAGEAEIISYNKAFILKFFVFDYDEGKGEISNIRLDDDKVSFKSLFISFLEHNKFGNESRPIYSLLQPHEYNIDDKRVVAFDKLQTIEVYKHIDDITGNQNQIPRNTQTEKVWLKKRRIENDSSDKYSEARDAATLFAKIPNKVKQMIGVTAPPPSFTANFYGNNVLEKCPEYIYEEPPPATSEPPPTPPPPTPPPETPDDQDMDENYYRDEFEYAQNMDIE